VKKNGEKFRKETSTVQPERSGGRLLVLGIFRHFLASGIKPAAFLFGSVSLSAVRKRNEHVQQRSRREAQSPPAVRPIHKKESPPEVSFRRGFYIPFVTA
jgi:hypothetical protein